MTDSVLIPSYAAQTEATCASHLGAYYLPKTYLRVVIEQVTIYRTKAGAKDKEKVTDYNEIKELREVRKPDRSQGYCLDYIASPTAKEKVDVVRDKDFLFHYISTESLDQSAYILKTLIRALFIGLSGNKDFQPFRSDKETLSETRSIVFEAEYDPFDVAQSAMINEALTAFQLCLVLESHTFDPHRLTIDGYCSDPRRAVTKLPAREAAVGGPVPVRRQANGIVYRPRLPYNLYAFTRGGNGQRGQRWSMAASEIVHLENEAPNLVIGIERSFFANRRATLLFDQGSLKNVCIHKTSELEQLSTVPLEIAGSIAALPTNILQVRIESTTNHKALVEAERRLIETQIKHIEFLADPTKVTPAPAVQQTKAAQWTTLPDGTVPGDIKPVDWPKSGGADWDICPKLTKAKETVLLNTSFVD